MERTRDLVVEFVCEDMAVFGDASDGFLRVHRSRLRNRRADGTVSRPFVCDFVSRRTGPDAVVVALYHRGTAGGPTRVFLREGLRPGLVFGRPQDRLPIPDRSRYLYFTEVVAGVIESGDVGEDGVRRRAAAEVAEEAGYEVDPSTVEFLGAGTFPTPGSMPEKFWLTMVEIQDPDRQLPPSGDGSPMEEGSRTRWADLDQTIAACVEGSIEDAKTELVLRRLKDRLAGR